MLPYVCRFWLSACLVEVQVTHLHSLLCQVHLPRFVFHDPTEFLLCCLPQLLAAWRSMSRLQRWYAQSLTHGSLLRDDQTHASDGHLRQQPQGSGQQGPGQHNLHPPHTTAGLISNGDVAAAGVPQALPAAVPGGQVVPANAVLTAVQDPSRWVGGKPCLQAASATLAGQCGQQH
jgi:hypothetical protein